MDVGGGDGAEHAAALARLHGERERGLLQLGGDFLRAGQLLGLAHGAALLERLDLLAVRAGERHRDAAGQEVIARITRADFDWVAFAAETVDGLDEEDVAVGHGMSGFKF